jgi:hypothetical protein
LFKDKRSSWNLMFLLQVIFSFVSINTNSMEQCLFETLIYSCIFHVTLYYCAICINLIYNQPLY